MSVKQIQELILRHAPDHGVADAAIEGLQLIRVTEPIPTVPSIYPASVCVLVQGTKRVYLGGESKTYGDGSFLCCTMPLPVEAEVPRASAKEPVLGLLLSLETSVMTETLIAAGAAEDRGADAAALEPTPGLVVAPWDDSFLGAVLRLLQLLDDPAARRVLVGARLRELYFTLLRSEAGAAVRRDLGASRDLNRALAYLHDRIAEPLSIDQLARVAGMSKAVFHRRFKAVTTLTPLQFMKAVRLNNAAAMIAGGMNASEAAGRVGYGSPSQFSREFSRMYGMPPRQWATVARPAGR